MEMAVEAVAATVQQTCPYVLAPATSSPPSAPSPSPPQLLIATKVASCMPGMDRSYIVARRSVGFLCVLVYVGGG
jgi:hypothetical protein